MSRKIGADIRSLPDIIVTRKDRARVHNAIKQYGPILSWPDLAFLGRELQRATVVDAADIPAYTVTMHSVVVFRDGNSGTDRVAQLAYPGERALRDGGGICILTLIGAALLGLSEGQSITYGGRDAERKTLTAVKVLHQPEACGDHRRWPANFSYTLCQSGPEGASQ